MLGFHPLSGAPISARRVTNVSPLNDPINLTQGLDDGLEDLGLELSQYWKIDDDVAAAVDPSLVYLLDITVDEIDEPVSFYQNAEDEETLAASFDLAEPIEQEAFDLSFYSQLDDDLAVAPDTLATLFDSILDDDVTQTDSDYFVIDDDLAVQPETLQQVFDLDPSVDQDSAELLDGLGLTSYQQLDDDPVAQPDALLIDLAFDDSTELDSPDLSAYAQIDDDAAQPDVLSVDQYFNDDTSTEPVELSIYSQVDDDAAQPDTIFGAFDFIEDAGIFDSGESFYYQQDDDVIVVTPPVTTAGGVAGHGRVHVLPGRHEDRATDRHHIDKREPFTPLREVKQAKETGSDLKALRDRLLDLGRALERNKQAVKDRIRAEQAREDSPELLAIMQLLIHEYELELYNQNAARLLIILADEI